MGDAKRRGTFEQRQAEALMKLEIENEKKRIAELKARLLAEVRKRERQFELDWAEARAENIWRDAHPGLPTPDRWLRDVAKRSVRHDRVGLVAMMGLAASTIIAGSNTLTYIGSRRGSIDEIPPTPYTGSRK